MAINAAKLLVEVGADVQGAIDGINSVDRAMKSNTQKLRSAGMGMTAGITLPLLGVAGAALTMAGDYEQSMNILQQTTGATASQMQLLNAQALQLGADTVFSAGEAAEAMLELGKAGMSTEQIMASIPGVMNLAAAGGIDVVNAASITATALNAFSLEASEAGRVADLLAGAANASNANIADLAAGVAQAGFAFAAANWPVEDLATSLAILTNVGLTGSDASTALKNAIMQMISPTQQAADLAQELGISFFDASGTMLSLPTIIDNLNTAFAGMSDEERNAALATLFMSDGMKAMIPLLEQGAGGFNSVKDTVTQAGAATDTAGARMKGLVGATEELSGSVESFLIGAAQPFLGVLADLVRSVADGITWFGSLPQPIINTGLALAAMAAAAGPLALLISGISAALGVLLGPVGLVILAVGALAAAWATDFGGIQGKTQEVIDAVLPALQGFLAGAQEVATGIVTAFSNTEFPSLQTLWEQFQAGDFQTIADTIRNTAYELMVNLDTELNITATANQLRDQLVGTVNDLATAVADIDFTGAINSLTTAINNYDWESLGSDIGSNIAAFMATDMTWAEQVAQNFADGVRGGFASVDWGAFDDAFGGLLMAVREAIYGVFRGMGTELGPLASEINSSFSEQMQSAGASIRESIASTVSGWNTSFSEALTQLGADIRTAIGGIFTSLFENLGGDIGSFTFELPTLDWNEYVAELAWVDWINENLNWPDFVMNLSWAEFINALAWSEFVNALGWNEFIASLNWNEFIAALGWSDFINSLSWASFIDGLSWGSYINDINWGSFVPDINWWDFVPRLNWGDFIDRLLGGFSASSSGGSTAPSGVRIPAGGILPALPRTKTMAAAAGGVNINVHVANMASDLDVQKTAATLAREFQRRVR